MGVGESNYRTSALIETQLVCHPMSVERRVQVSQLLIYQASACSADLLIYQARRHVLLFY